MSDNKQLNLFNSLGNTTTSDALSQESTKWATIGQTHTSNPVSIRKRNKVQWRKRQLVAYKGGKCERCGGEYHENVYDFHHYDQSLKSFAVNQSTYQRKWIDLVAEVDKCFLLCSNCHREVHTFNEPTFIKSNPKGVL